MATDPYANALVRSRRNLRLLWVGHFVSHTGDTLFARTGTFLVATLLFSNGLDAATLEVSSVDFMRALPILLFSLLGGVLADRFDRRGLMITADLLRAFIVGLLPLAWLCGLLVWWLVPLGAFLVSCCTALFEPAQNALLPTLAEGRPLLKVNAAFQTSVQGAMLAGAALTALAGFGASDSVAAANAQIAAMMALIGADAASFLVSALTLWRIRRPPETADAPVSARKRGFSSWEDIKAAATLATRDGRLRTLLLLTMVNNFFIMGPAWVGGAVMYKRELGRGLGDYGLFETGLAAGWLLGTLAVLRWGGKWRKGPMVLAGLVFDGLTYLPFLWLGADSPPWVFLALITFHALFIPLIGVARAAIVQSYYPPEMHGRIFGLVSMSVIGCAALSSAAAGIALRFVSAFELYFIAGAGGAAVGVLGLFSASLRRTA